MFITGVFDSIHQAIDGLFIFGVILSKDEPTYQPNRSCGKAERKSSDWFAVSPGLAPGLWGRRLLPAGRQFSRRHSAWSRRQLLWCNRYHPLNRPFCRPGNCRPVPPGSAF